LKTKIENENLTIEKRDNMQNLKSFLPNNFTCSSSVDRGTFSSFINRILSPFVIIFGLYVNEISEFRTLSPNLSFVGAS